MDPSLIGGLIGSLCDCVFWIVLIGGVIFFLMRGRDEDSAEAISEMPEVPGTPDAEQAAAPSASSGTPAADEAPPPPPPPAPAAEDKPKPPPRATGATIIAFDDDFDDED